MITDKKFSELVDGLLDEYGLLIDTLISLHVTSFAKNRKLNVQDVAQINENVARHAEKLSVLKDQIAYSYANKLERSVYEALLASHNDDLRRLGAKPLDVGSIPLAYVKRAERTASSLKEILKRQNTAMCANAERVYREVVEESITKFVHERYSMEYVVSTGVQKLVNEGVKTVDYASGKRSDPHAALSRHLVTQTARVGGELTEACMRELGHDLVYVSSHFGARPSHAVWQGKVYSLSGKTQGYLTLEEGCGYGSITGLHGINCRHSFGPYYEGITPIEELPVRINGYTSNEYYEGKQKLNQANAQIRKYKREIKALDEAGIKHSYANLRLAEVQKSKRIIERSYGFNIPAKNKLVEYASTERGITDKARRFKNTANFAQAYAEGKFDPELFKVNFKYINSTENRMKYKKLMNEQGLDEQLGLQIFKSARDILYHRAASPFEDIHYFDVREPKAPKLRLTKPTEPFVVQEANDRLKHLLANTPPDTLITVHNHPRSTLPSIGDFKACAAKKLKLGIVACHDGSVYWYKCSDIALQEAAIEQKIRRVASMLRTQDNNIHGKLSVLDDYEKRATEIVYNDLKKQKRIDWGCL